MALLQNKRILGCVGLLFLVFSTSWLFAPSLVHYLTIGPNLISEYESTAVHYGWIFRLFDGLAALTLLATAFATRKQLAHRWGKYTWPVFSCIALLMLVDIAVPAECTLRHGICSPNLSLTTLVHGAESLLLGGIVAVFSMYIAWRYKKGRWFVVVQLVSLLLGLMSYKYGQSWRFTTQAAYQVLQAYWIYGLVFANTGPIRRQDATTHSVRNILAIWVAMNGVIALLLSWHHIAVGRVRDSLFFSGDASWLLGHTILIGLLLLYLARQLWLGERRAYVLTNILLLSELLRFSATRNGHVFIILFGVSLLVMLQCKDVFDRHGSFVGFTSRLRFLATGLLLGVSLITLGTAAFRIHNHRVWKHSAFDVAHVVQRAALLEISSHPGEPLRARLFNQSLSLVGASTYIWLVVGIFLPGKLFHKQDYDSYTVLKKLQRYSSSSEDYFKLWPADKQYFATKAGSLVAYGENNGNIVALANPLGDQAQRSRDIEEFKNYCRRYGFKSAWLLVNDSTKATYKKAGYKVLMIGSSAVIPVADFCGRTLQNKWWRWQMNRAAKVGYTYQALSPPFSGQTLLMLQQISAAWLERPGHTEQTFALGFLDEGYLQQCRLHCLYDKNGAMVAFANELPIFSGQQTTVDMIRFMPDANGVMSVLVANILLQLHKEGVYTHFDLGFVPLAKIDTIPAKAIAKLMKGKFSAGGLSQFKNKFEPSWQPNYLAYDGDMVDVAKIIVSLSKLMEYKNNPKAYSQ